MPYPHENVRIRAGAGLSDVVTISREACAELLRRDDVPATVREAFENYDESGEAPVDLDREEKRELLVVLERWLKEIGEAALPRGILGLRNALADEL